MFFRHLLFLLLLVLLVLLLLLLLLLLPMLQARTPHTLYPSTFYLSPEGKRFRSLQGAKHSLKHSVKDFQDSQIIFSPKKLFAKRKEEEDRKPQLTEKARMRRKVMLARMKPFTSLHRKTLLQNAQKAKKKQMELTRKNKSTHMKHKNQNMSNIQIVTRLQNRTKQTCQKSNLVQRRAMSSPR